MTTRNILVYLSDGPELLAIWRENAPDQYADALQYNQRHGIFDIYYCGDHNGFSSISLALGEESRAKSTEHEGRKGSR